MTTDQDKPSILRALRVRRGLLLRDAAKACGVTKSGALRWDRMEIEPRPEHRAAYARFLGISVAKLGSLIYEASVEAARKAGK